MQYKPYYHMTYAVVCALKVIINVVKRMRFVGVAPNGRINRLSAALP